jgi:iron complex outermembrane receptor protein
VFAEARIAASLSANYVGKQYSTSAIPVVNNATGFTAAEQASLIGAITIPKHWVFNGRISLKDITVGGAKATLSVWGQNLFDDKTPSYIVPLSFFYATDYQRARTLGVELAMEF